jgi:ribonuclease-3
MNQHDALTAWALTSLGHQFRRPALLAEAMTHTTWANENPPHPSNQRLEFLGDAVVGLVMAQALYTQYPHLPEGELTKIRAAVVREEALAARARALGLGVHLRLGKGELATGRNRDSILADAFEAVVGALYLDGGLEVARTFVLRELLPLAEIARQGQLHVDWKTRLQEHFQRDGGEAPSYQLLEEEGPAHQKRFRMGVYREGRQLAAAWGRSKKEAEQEAARLALEAVRQG